MPNEQKILATADTVVAVVGQFNALIPIVWGLYRTVHGWAADAGVDAPVLTDEQLISLLKEDADTVVAKANEYLAKYGTPK